MKRSPFTSYEEKGAFSYRGASTERIPGRVSLLPGMPRRFHTRTSTEESCPSNLAKLRLKPREIAPGNARWDDTTRLWPVEFEGQEWRALQQFVRAYQGWPMDQRSEELYEKVVNQI